MPDISLSVLRSNDPSGSLRPGETVAAHYNGPLRAVVIEHGMASGQPSVALIVPLPGGDEVTIIETSLLIFQAAARGLVGMAETQLGWTMPP